MRDKPLVSVCMTCFNQREYIEQALDSVLRQTYDNYEVVISDDCSTDGTSELIRKIIDQHPDRNIYYNRNADNVGVVRNSAACMGRAHGELLVLAHDDDISRSDRLEKVVQAWLSTGKKATAVIHGWYKIDARGRAVGEQGPWGPVGEWENREKDGDYFRKCWPLGAAMAVVPKCVCAFWSASRECGFEDVVYLNRAMMLGYPLYIDDRLLYYRIGSGMTTSYSVRRAQQRQSLGGVVGSDQSLEDLGLCTDPFCLAHKASIAAAIMEHRQDFVNVGLAFAQPSVSLSTAVRAPNLMLQSTLPRRFIVPLLFLPPFIGNPIMNQLTRLLWCLRAWRHRKDAMRWHR